MKPKSFNNAPKQKEENQPSKGQGSIDPMGDFRAFVAGYGFDPGPIIPDGKRHKFSTKEGDGKDKAGWYVFFQGDICGAALGDWRSGIRENLCSVKREDRTPEQHREYAEIKKKNEDRCREAEAKQLILYDEKALEVQTLWAAAKPIEEVGHTYPERKGIDASGYRVHFKGGYKALLVPRTRRLPNGHLEFRNVEHIWESPKMHKHGYKKAETAGTFHIIQGQAANNVVYIAEGFSTGKTINMATGSEVVCSFNAGNMPNIAETVRDMYPGRTIIVAGDNDQFNKPRPNGEEDNTGKKNALKVGEMLGVPVVFPEFKDLSGEPTDFNDLMMLEGIEVASQQLKAVLPQRGIIEEFFEGPTGNFFAASENGTEEQQFIFSRPGKNKPGGLRTDVIGYAGGEGGAGKTRIWFQIGASIAFGHDFTRGAYEFHETGPFYMVAGEDGQDIMAEAARDDQVNESNRIKAGQKIGK